MEAGNFGDGWGPVEKLSSLSRVQSNLQIFKKAIVTKCLSLVNLIRDP